MLASSIYKWGSEFTKEVGGEDSTPECRITAVQVRRGGSTHKLPFQTTCSLTPSQSAPHPPPWQPPP